MQFLVKVVVSALIVAGVSELGRRYTLLAAILASLPLTSILAIVWLYHDTRDTAQVVQLTQSIFWVVLPSLVFLLVVPLLLKAGVSFVPALLASCGVMVVTYWLYSLLLTRLGIIL